jgi:hypothetical protein
MLSTYIRPSVLQKMAISMLKENPGTQTTMSVVCVYMLLLTEPNAHRDVETTTSCPTTVA